MFCVTSSTSILYTLNDCRLYSEFSILRKNFFCLKREGPTTNLKNFTLSIKHSTDQKANWYFGG